MSARIPSDLSFILNGLYLSSVETAMDYNLLKMNGITHIINLSHIENIFPTKFTYYRIKIDDIPNSNIKQYFPSTFKFIDDALNKNGKVLVHCTAGISRSATIIIAYLMTKLKIPLNQAIDYTRTQRSIIAPNPGFINQLYEYYLTLIA